MKIEAQCTNASCKAPISADDSRIGQTVVCPQCGHETMIRPDGETAAPLDSTHDSSQSHAANSTQKKTEKGKALVPRQIGRFEIRKRLGSGGFGTVYLAHDPVLDRDVALKVPQPAVLENPRARERFLREPKAAAQLQHPNIVPIFDTGTDGEHHYIASAYIEGKTLQETIAQERLDFRRSAELVRDLAGALDYAHSKGIVHRDVKPANVMVNASGQPMLMDFGLAHLQESEDQLTRDGAIMGTPAYMAPEQADRAQGEVGPASDQYALGVVLYHLVCGEPPFSGPPSVVLFNLLNQEPKAPRAQDASIPKDLETICLKAMAKDPGARYPDCAALAEDLRRWLGDEPIQARRIGPMERFGRWYRKNPALAASTILAFVLLAASTILFASYWQTAEDRSLAEQARHAEELKRKISETALSERERDVQLAQGKLAEAENFLEEESARRELAEAERKLLDAKSRVLAEEKQTVEQARLEAETSREQLAGQLEKTQEDLEFERCLKNPKVPELAPIVTARKPGEPLNVNALVSNPVPLPRVKSWTIETTAIRGDVQPTLMEYSPDGTELAVGTAAGVVRLYDTETSLLRRAIVCTKGTGVRGLSWSPDGSHIAVTTDHECALLIFQVDPLPRLVACLPTNGCVYVSWSPDGTRVANGGTIYDLANGKRIDLLDELDIFASEWSPDATQLAIGCNSSVQIWDVKNRKIARELNEHGNDRADQLAWSPRGDVLAIGTLNPKKTYLYSTRTGEVIASILEDNAVPWCWTADSRWLLVDFAGHGESTLWNPFSGDRVSVSGVSGFVLSPNQLWVAGLPGNHRPGLSFVNLRDGSKTSTEAFAGILGDLRFSMTGKWLASAIASWAGTDEIRVMSVEDRTSFRSVPVADPTLPFFDWVGERPVISTAKYGQRLINFTDVSTLERLDVAWQDGPPSATSLLCSPDGKYALVSRKDAGAVLLEVKSGRQVAMIPVANQACWSNDGKRFLIGRTVFSAHDGKKLASLSFPTADESILACAFSKDGAEVAFSSENGRLYIVDVASSQVVDHWLIGVQSPSVIWWSDSSNQLRIVSQVGTVHHVDRAAGQTREIDVNCDWYDVDIHPDGSYAAAKARWAGEAVVFIDIESGDRLATWLSLNAGKNMMISPGGHWRGPKEVDNEIVYVVETIDGQETLTPAQMRDKYGWINDPSKVEIKWPEPVKEDSTPAGKLGGIGTVQKSDSAVE